MEILNINWGNALTVLGLGIGIVFTVLVLLVFILTAFSWFFVKKEKPVATAVPTTTADVPDETEKAAVAMALHLFFQDIHDEESYTITIQQDSTPYSPWNSKIYGLNNVI